MNHRIPTVDVVKIAPPAARYVDKQSKFAPKAPVKPSIKYFLADSTGIQVEIDPSKISTKNTSTDSESEIFHEALEARIRWVPTSRVVRICDGTPFCTYSLYCIIRMYPMVLLQRTMSSTLAAPHPKGLLKQLTSAKLVKNTTSST